MLTTATQVTPVETIKIDTRYLAIKRVLDISLVLLALLPLGIVMACIALFIRLDSQGPVLFRQKRLGQNGVEFEMLKFRSMHAGSDDGPHRESIARYMLGQKVNAEAPGGFPYKLTGDQRVTRVGRIIRKTSLDELPQMFNVLRGEMSLVGPRPPLPYEAEHYRPRDHLRLCGKPGITGPWQIYGRSRVTFQKMVEMDIAYLRRQSPWQDLKLIALTVPVVFQGRGGA